MEIEGWSQTLTAAPLLFIAAGAIVVLLLLIMWLKVHAFLALIIVSILTAFATGIPAGSVVEVIQSGFGTTLGSVALLVGLGAMLGRLIEVSGGAAVLSNSLIWLFGERHAPLALGVASLLFGFPIFFDAGLVVMLPVVFAVARRLGGSLLLYGLPAAGAFSVMHIFVPPHPGPVSASEFLGANPGYVLILGLVVALPTWVVTGYLFGLATGRRINIPVPNILGQADEEAEANPPSFGIVLFVLLLPLVLIFLNTGLDMLDRGFGIVDGDAAWFQFLRALGATPIALLISLLVAIFLLGFRRGTSGTVIEKTVDGALGPISSVVLITGAGGMFGYVLRTSGIGDALADSLDAIGMPLILAGFVIAGLLRVAQGSATVALTTAAGLLAPAVAAAAYNEFQLAAMVISIAAGSVILSHVNDSGFWLVGRFFEMDVRTTLKTWTVMETAIGVMGFVIAWAAFGLTSAL